MGEEEAEVVVVKNDAGLRFFLSVTGDVSDPSSFSSLIGVKDDKGGLKMVRLFRRLLSDMVHGEAWWLKESQGMIRPRPGYAVVRETSTDRLRRE